EAVSARAPRGTRAARASMTRTRRTTGALMFATPRDRRPITPPPKRMRIRTGRGRACGGRGRPLMRIALTALGTIGDVAPMLRIAEALEAGGTETIVFVNPFFEAHPRSLGLSVRAVGEPWDPEQIA